MYLSQQRENVRRANASMLEAVPTNQKHSAGVHLSAAQDRWRIRRDDGLKGLLLSEHVLSTVPPVADFSRDPVRVFTDPHRHLSLPHVRKQ